VKSILGTRYLWRGKSLVKRNQTLTIAADVADIFVIYRVIIRMAEGYLHVWGKNFPQPTQLKQKVILAAAGENHILFTTGII
jgi:hypothetical protein